MNALTIAERLELSHLATVTRDGKWSFRGGNTALHKTLTKRGFVETRITPTDSGDYIVCRITPAGIAVLEGGAPSTVCAWCDGCGAVVAWRCVYDHVRGEVWECTACVEREGVR